MTINKNTSRMIKWSILSTTLIAAWWMIYQMIGGDVPATATIIEGLELTLPFPISRWWDIMIGPMGSIMIIPLSGRLHEEEKYFITGLTIGGGCSAWSLLGLVDDPPAMFIAACFILIIGVVLTLAIDVRTGIGYYVMSYIIYALVIGIPFGVVYLMTAITGFLVLVTIGLIFGGIAYLGYAAYKWANS